MGAKARRPGASASRRSPGGIVKLDAAVYTEEAIARTRGAFSHLAAVDVRRTGRCWTVRFSQADPAVAERLADEFCNYALSCLVVAP